MKTADSTAQRLDAAAARCAADGVRFTDLRRQVLAFILEAPGPITAYALLDLLRPTRWNAAPPTVYRALDFLQQRRLVHRVERLNAYVGCDEGEAHEHAVQFLICNTCGAVDEVDDHAVSAALDHAAAAKGFRPGHATVEVEGTCAGCAAAAPG